MTITKRILTRASAFATALAVSSAALLVAAAEPAHAACARAHIWSTDTGLLWSAEKDYAEPQKGEIRARTNSLQAGSWEVFMMCFIDSTTVNIQALANGLYIAREEGYSGTFKNMLRARTPADRLGTWEQFSIYNIRADAVGFLGTNSRFVVNEQAFSGKHQYMLRADRTSFGPWEAYEYVFNA